MFHAVESMSPAVITNLQNSRYVLLVSSRVIVVFTIKFAPFYAVINFCYVDFFAWGSYLCYLFEFESSDGLVWQSNRLDLTKIVVRTIDKNETHVEAVGEEVEAGREEGQEA